MIFLMSIIEGLAVLGHWEVWASVVLYLAAVFVFMRIGATVMGADEYSGRDISIFLFYIMGASLFQGILMSLMIAFLLPILLGGPSATPISVIVVSLWPIIKIGVIASILVTISCFIPLIGGFIRSSPGIQVFLEGVVIFRLLSEYAIGLILTEANVYGNVYPGFWASIGFLIIAGVLVMVMMMGLPLLLRLLSISPYPYNPVAETLSIVAGSVIGVLGGILPIFMYSSYVQLSIIQLLGG